MPEQFAQAYNDRENGWGVGYYDAHPGPDAKTFFRTEEAAQAEAVRYNLEARGFKYTEMGGGCTAYVRTVDDVETLVTWMDDPKAPIRMDEAVAVTKYNTTTQAQIGSEHAFHTLWEAWNWLRTN